MTGRAARAPVGRRGPAVPGRAARAALWAGAAAGLGLLVWLAFGGHGFLNYDTAYGLVWGRELAHGHAPNVDVPLAPTFHPLLDVVGIVLSPLSSAGGAVHGRASEDLLVAVAFLALGTAGVLVFALAQAWYGTVAGVVATVLLLTREPVLSYGVRAYVDLPYMCLVLGAILVETRRPRAGAPVLALLAFAGLLRPEAWLLSAAYLAWMWWPERRIDLRLVLIAASGPVLWALHDLVATGDPLHSLTGTRETADTLGRVTGLQHVPTTGPRRIGEIVREPVLVGAAVGAVLAWRGRERGPRLGLAALAAALVAFAVLATAGLPILTRYLLVPGAILIVLCAGAVVSSRWAAIGLGVLLLIFVPSQAHRLHRLHDAMAAQSRILSDLRDVAGTRPCTPVIVPNRRPIPQLALWLDTDPGRIASAADVKAPPSRGTYVGVASRAVARKFVLDPRDPVQTVAAPPRGFARAGGNASWSVFARCGP